MGRVDADLGSSPVPTRVQVAFLRSDKSRWAIEAANFPDQFAFACAEQQPLPSGPVGISVNDKPPTIGRIGRMARFRQYALADLVLLTREIPVENELSPEGFPGRVNQQFTIRLPRVMGHVYVVL